MKTEANQVYPSGSTSTALMQSLLGKVHGVSLSLTLYSHISIFEYV